MNLTVGQPQTVTFTVPQGVNPFRPRLVIQASKGSFSYSIGQVPSWTTIRSLTFPTSPGASYNPTTRQAVFNIAAITAVEAGCAFAERYGVQPFAGRYVFLTSDQIGQTWSQVEAGDVTFSGCDSEGGNGDGDGGGSEEQGESDVLTPPPAEPDEPCLPPSYSAPAVPVDTPCDSNSGGTGPGGFGNP